MLNHLRTLAQYNRWSGERLLGACGALPEDEYMKARPAAYGSMHGTLNHILLADHLWLDRLEGRPDPAVPDPATILHQDLEGLREGRHEADRRITHYIDSLTPDRLEHEVVYRTRFADTFSTKVVLILTHMFHHADHHRGQVHDMLSQVPVEPPTVGLICFLRECP